MLQELYSLKKEKTLKTHSGTIAEFGLEYIINNNFDKNISKIFSELEDDRIDSDYDFDFDATKTIAKTDLERAEKFIEECKKFL